MNIERALQPWLRANSGAPIEVLDVGGAGDSRINLPGMRRVVLDVSEESLARCTDAAERLLGDAQSFDYGERRFDLVIFWNVLEHIPDPVSAVKRAAATVKPGGMVIIAGPVIRSLKALVTRRTPHRWHVIFYKKVLGKLEAGTGGTAPFPVEHAKDAEPERLAGHLQSEGFSLYQEYRYVGDQVWKLKRYSRLLFSAYEMTRRLFAAATRNIWGTRETEFILLLRKAPRVPAE